MKIFAVFITSPLYAPCVNLSRITGVCTSHMYVMTHMIDILALKLILQILLGRHQLAPLPFSTLRNTASHMIDDFVKIKFKIILLGL